MKMSSCLILAVFLSASCNNSNDKQAEERDLSIVDTAALKTGNELNETTIAALDNIAVFRFTRSRVPEFSWNSFQLTRFWTEDSLFSIPFTPEDGYFKNYGPLLKYSPDSSKFIDLDSYNIAIQLNADGERIGLPQGPDMEISLVDLETKLKTRLLFLGPGGNVEDASWLDNQNLVLVNSVDTKDGPPGVSLIKYNLPSKTFSVYETTDTSLISNLKGYAKSQRLKDVKMQ